MLRNADIRVPPARLGVIFLRHDTNRYDTPAARIAAGQTAGKLPLRVLVTGDFLKYRALPLPQTPSAIVRQVP